MRKNNGEKIVLGICSSVSLYKSCEIVRGFQREGHQVQVIMTKNATRLISPLLFNSLTGISTFTDLFGEEYSGGIAHVDLAKEIALLLVAPATANIIGKFASGVADDFLSTFYLAVSKPVLIAPAMNENMYLHAQTQQNIQTLKAAGVHFVEPEIGYLACADEGQGRLANPETIVKEGLKLIQKSQSLKGKSVLVTAGPTREFLDPVRFLTNRSSGRMGFELAHEALHRSAEVTLISGPVQLFPPKGAKFVKVQTAQEMDEAVGKSFDKADIVLMAAAVSDFRFLSPALQKIKKQALPKSIKIVQTPDILKKCGEKKKGKILVGFAAETEDVNTSALRKARQKNLDFIVANDVSETEIGFESNYNRVTIVFPDGKKIETGRKSKREISQVIFDEIEAIIGKTT